MHTFYGGNRIISRHFASCRVNAGAAPAQTFFCVFVAFNFDCEAGERMFELRLLQGSLLKKVIEAIKDLVVDANFDCSTTGFALQAMDSSHVALVSLLLRSEGFEHYRCDRSISMGMNIANMAKMLKCAGNDDIITVKADDGTDTVTFMFESPNYIAAFSSQKLSGNGISDSQVLGYLTRFCLPMFPVLLFWIINDQDKITEIEMKLMDIDSDHLGIPEAEFDAIVRMPSTEFAGICQSLSTIGDTVTISVSKQGITFSTKGDIGTGNITCRQNTSVEKPEEATVIQMQEPVVLTFALKYINTFTKATSLSNQVTVSMSADMPIVIEYKIAETGYIRFFLAPKLEEENLESNHQPQMNSRPEVNSKSETQDNPQEEMET
ncbi:hypothetical protein Nepgr_032413 [Nepenthes gracilis]|uniref:DNA sliding clamp PCNA n=1 Tax=Nepenthes gracilis TaxID=150966 RepID=A0AAD3Y7N3_NEPGR|nr:hypothetical protein Nepgr_032413 [Nepenthes gracilis]